MRVGATLALFAVGVVAAFVLAFGVGRAVGPVGGAEPAVATTTTEPHGGVGHP